MSTSECLCAAFLPDVFAPLVDSFLVYLPQFCIPLSSLACLRYAYFCPLQFNLPKFCIPLSSLAYLRYAYFCPLQLTPVLYSLVFFSLPQICILLSTSKDGGGHTQLLAAAATSETLLTAGGTDSAGTEVSQCDCDCVMV